ncbi:MAG: hypothetical protein QF662_00845 [Phycisphaerae bacterium]|nr:hypothetical protein [Phycisphaerae bacterium]
MDGKVITVRGPVEPEALGAVMNHEHLHADMYDWEKQEVIVEEHPISDERRALLMNEAMPFLKRCTEHGCFAYLDTTIPPWRAWPTFYAEVSEAADMHIILSTGCYREVEVGSYWVKTPDDAIWPLARKSSAEELAEIFTREILEGIHGTKVCAGAIKLGTSAPELTKTERKAFSAGAQAQKATGVHITTHCPGKMGAETGQLAVLDEEGVDLNRVVIGHTAPHLMDPDCRKACMDWMKRGANFLLTNLGIGADGGEVWQPLIDAIHEVFDAGLGEKIAGFGLDWAFCSESGPFGPCNYVPGPPYLHMFTHTLPAFRRMGLTVEEEEAIMRTNPQRIFPVRK